MASDIIRPSVWKLFARLLFVAALIAGLVVFVGGGTDQDEEPAAAESVVATPAEDPDIQTIDTEIEKVSDNDFGDSGLSDAEVGLSE